MAERSKAAVLKTVESLRAPGVRIPLSPAIHFTNFKGLMLIKVLLVDDHELVRMGIKRLLQDASGIKVVGEASSGEAAKIAAKELAPDVVIMDINMPGIGGYAATSTIIRQNPDTKVLALTIYEDEPYPSRILKAGASGYITKGCSSEEMIRAIRLIHSGQHYISPKVAQQIAIKRYSSSDKSLLDVLSERELQIMLMITQGQKVLEISKKLCLSPKTVNSYRYRIFDKLNVDNDVELTLMAVRLGLLQGETFETEQ